MEELDKILDRYRPHVLLIDPLQSYNNLVESSNDQIRELLKRLKQGLQYGPSGAKRRRRVLEDNLQFPPAAVQFTVICCTQVSSFEY